MIQIDPYRGLVFERYGYNDQRRIFWVNCPKHGPMVPSVTLDEGGWRLFKGLRTKEGEWAFCSYCHTKILLRMVIVPADKQKSNERCTNRCLDGSSGHDAHCRCGCLGQCHGQSVCSCKGGD